MLGRSWPTRYVEGLYLRATSDKKLKLNATNIFLSSSFCFFFFVSCLQLSNGSPNPTSTMPP